MRQFLIFSFLMVAGTVAFGQKSIDTSVSANNYKHANKAAYAKKHNLDKTSEMKMIAVADNGDYKHPFRKSRMTKKAALSTGTGYTGQKHPNGL